MSAYDRQAARPVAVSVEGVSRDFVDPNSGKVLPAVDDVSLDIHRGEFLCLLGPSGCGKSTLLNIIGGLLHPTSGRATIDGRAIAGPSPDQIAFVFQESTLFPWYTVMENFNVALRFRKRPRVEWHDQAMSALADVGMSAFAHHYPGQLSLGMRQRVNLARSLCMDTDIILMDEPFASLDEQSRMVLGEDLSALLEKTGKTIIFVTHSLSEAVFLSDRIVVMTARPAKVKKIISVSEPHPRRPSFMLEPRFSELRNELYALLRDEIRLTMESQKGVPTGEHGA